MTLRTSPSESTLTRVAKDAGGHGREPRITEARTRKICDAIATGSAFEVSARYAGVPKDTFWRWVRLGRQEGADAVYVKFVERLDAAFATFKVDRARRLSEAGGKDGDWRADAFALERRDPEHWGKTTRVEGAVTHQAVPWIDFSKLDAADRAELRRILEKGRPETAEIPAPARRQLEAGDPVPV